jgi:hypothetical protein
MLIEIEKKKRESLEDFELKDFLPLSEKNEENTVHL